MGVAPEHWREGLGSRVRARFVERLASVGHSSVQLLVYTDNKPAIQLYERLGWIAVDEPPRPHPRTGRLERRYRLNLAGRTRVQRLQVTGPTAPRDLGIASIDLSSVDTAEIIDTVPPMIYCPTPPDPRHTRQRDSPSALPLPSKPSTLRGRQTLRISSGSLALGYRRVPRRSVASVGKEKSRPTLLLVVRG